MWGICVNKLVFTFKCKHHLIVLAQKKLEKKINHKKHILYNLEKDSGGGGADDHLLLLFAGSASTQEQTSQIQRIYL